MARSTGSAEAMRSFFKKHGPIGMAEARPLLQAEGAEVPPSSVFYSIRKEFAGRRKSQTRSTKGRALSESENGDAISLTLLQSARDFCNEAGGAENAALAIAAWSSLMPGSES